MTGHDSVHTAHGALLAEAPRSRALPAGLLPACQSQTYAITGALLSPGWRLVFALIQFNKAHVSPFVQPIWLAEKVAWLTKAYQLILPSLISAQLVQLSYLLQVPDDNINSGPSKHCSSPTCYRPPSRL